MKTGRRFRALAAAAFMSWAGPGVAGAIDLDEAWRLALRNDPELASARMTLRADLEALPQARATLLPSVNLSANTSDNQRDIQGAFSEGFNNHGWSASLTQPVFRLSEYFLFQEIQALNRQREAEFAALQQGLITRVAEAYFGVLEAREELLSSGAEEEALASQLNQAKESHEVGLVSLTDVLEAQAAYDLARVAHGQHKGELDIAVEILETLVGQRIDEISELSPELPVREPDPEDREAWVETALRQNHTLQASMLAGNVARKELKARKAEHLPTVDFVASYNRTVQGGLSFLGGKINNRTYTLEFNMPLFAGGRTRSRVREAGYRIEAAQETSEQVRQRVAEDIRVLHRLVTLDVYNIRALKQAIASARSALKATEVGYEVGTRNSVEVLQARRAVFAAERDHAAARYQYVINTFRLKEVAGTLSPQDVQEISVWLRGASRIH